MIKCDRIISCDEPPPVPRPAGGVIALLTIPDPIVRGGVKLILNVKLKT